MRRIHWSPLDTAHKGPASHFRCPLWVFFSIPETTIHYSFLPAPLQWRHMSHIISKSSVTRLLLQKLVNSFPPSAAYMRQSIGKALVQIMAFRLFGAKPLSEPTLGYCHYWILMNNLQWNFNQYTKLFIHENASEDILCEVVAILSRGRWVNQQRKNQRSASPTLCELYPGMTSGFASTKGQ